MSRLKDKVEEIEKYLQELSVIIPKSFEEYKSNFGKKAACERYFEKIMEAIIDLAFIIIRKNDFVMPENETQVFEILNNKKIIPDKLTKKLKEAKSMRNFVIHRYGQIDDKIMFESLKNEIIKDVKEFINIMGRMK